MSFVHHSFTVDRVRVSKNRVLSFELQAVKIKVDDHRMKIFDDTITANESSKSCGI